MSGVIHNFQDSLAKSHAQSDASWWLEVYRKAFPSMISAVNVRRDGWAQRAGIDRIITLSGGRTISVDEKVREKDWPDILLERWSDEARRIPGWIQKDLACDFIAYAFVPRRTCYLFPTLTLQRAWFNNGKEWISKFKEVRAQNNGYVTVSVAIPIDVLFSSLSDAMRFMWGGNEKG